MSVFRLSDGPTRGDLVRWTACFVLILGIHGGVAAALVMNHNVIDGDVIDTSDAVEVDFTTEAFQEAVARDIAPGEEQVQTDAAPPPQEETVEKKTEPEVEPQPELPPQPTQEAEKLPPLPQVENPEVALTAATPPPKKEVEEDKKEDDVKKVAVTSPPLVTASTTTAPTIQMVRTGSVISWKSKLARHLQRNKRYPSAAQARREFGTAKVSFVVDRQGHILSSKIVQSSGSVSLDEETLALLQRAQPLPTPPTDVPGTQFAFSVPVRFDLK